MQQIHDACYAPANEIHIKFFSFGSRRVPYLAHKIEKRTEQHIEPSHVVFYTLKCTRFVVEQMAMELQSRMLSVFAEHCVTG